MDAAFPATVIILDIVNLDVNPMGSTLSLHALRPGFPWMAFAFLINAVAVGLVAWGLHLLPPRPWAAPACLIMAGIASALLSYFAADAPSHETTYGHIHEAIAPIAFLGISVGGLFAIHAQRTQPQWKGLYRVPQIFCYVLLAAEALMGILVLVAQFYDPAHGLYGIAERFIVIAIGGWIVATAVQGSRAARRQPPRVRTQKVGAAEAR